MMSRGRSGITVGCRGGGCGVCKVRVVEGRYRTGVMSVACVSHGERAQGVALACKLFPESDLRLEVMGNIGPALSRKRGATVDLHSGARSNLQSTIHPYKEK